MSPRTSKVVESAAMLALLLMLALMLLAAFLIGENNRCSTLTREHSPLTAQYCEQGQQR